MTTIWDGASTTPAATHRVPVDVSSSGGPTRWTGQQIADLRAYVGGTVNNLGSINTNQSLSLADGLYIAATITGNVQFTFTSVPTGFTDLFLELTNAGAHTVSFAATIGWTGGTTPSLPAVGVALIHLYTRDGGTSYIAHLVSDEQQFDAAAIVSGTLDAARLPAPVNTRWIGAGELIPRVTNGAGIDGEELATNDINLDYLAFDSATSEGAQVSFAWPGAYTTCTATFFWTAASGSGGVRWQASATCYADDAALDAAQGTLQAVSDTLLAANDAHQSSATSAITPAGTVASGNLCVVEVERDPAHADDTLAVDARLIGVMLEFA